MSGWKPTLSLIHPHYFDTSAPNDIEMALNTTRATHNIYIYMIYIYITSVLESQISVRFALQPTVLELPALLRQVQWMTPNDLDYYKVKGTPC